MKQLIKEKDQQFVNKHMMNENDVARQLERFKVGFDSIELEESASIGNGILNITADLASFINRYEKSDLRVMKFVPASGAASRMFKKLFEFKEDSQHSMKASEEAISENEFIHKFFEDLKSFAFYEDLKQKFKKIHGTELEDAFLKKRYNQILDTLLEPSGLNYGNLPKGLLKFHSYDNNQRTPAQEHLEEGMTYAMRNDNVNIHFTVSPEHLEDFKTHIDNSIAKLEANFNVSFSTQKPKTDTIAATLDNEPFRKENGELLFRPAGHGALLENLDDIESDIIFIKNIDNVVPDRLKKETIDYKKALAGVLLTYQERAFDLLKKSDLGENVSVEGKTLLEEMGLRGDLSSEQIIEKLNRPIRVCGMVKNEGEPGGGPFWTKDNLGHTSLQIIESAQVDSNRNDQLNTFNKSTHFNPVDLVCGVVNYKGEKFDLLKYRDMNSGFITEKSYEGRKLKAMELPGLWNGSMADWNTIFVEVPLITFNPVKTVNDLLIENHR